MINREWRRSVTGHNDEDRTIVVHHGTNRAWVSHVSGLTPLIIFPFDKDVTV